MFPTLQSTFGLVDIPTGEINRETSGRRGESRSRIVKRVLCSSFAIYALALGLIGCTSGPRVATGDDSGSAPLTEKQVAILGAGDKVGVAGAETARLAAASENEGFTLGAGDALGRHVFTHAVALARAESVTGWRYADASVSGNGIENDRAIYAPFLGVERPVNTYDAFETVWIYTSLTHPRNNTANLGRDAVTNSPAPEVIVLVPEN